LAGEREPVNFKRSANGMKGEGMCI